MPGVMDFNIRGAKEMEALLTKLGPEVANKVGDQAVRAGGKIIADEARRLVPYKSGALHDSIGVAVLRRGVAMDERVAHVGFHRPVSARAHLTEFGTAHSAAKPFLRPALDSRANDAFQEMGKVLARGITREARKLAKPIKRGR